jgi:sugar lactone lactonase YvrE
VKGFLYGVGLASLVLFSACSGGNGPGAGSCDPVGQGTLQVSIGGLPPGVSARVGVSGPGFSQVLTASQSLSLGGGSYTIAVKKTTSPVDASTVVRTAYAGTSDRSQVCVRNNETAQVTVTYSQIPSSSKLWTNNRPPKSAGDPPTHGYAGVSLLASGTVAETVGAGTVSSRDLTFDADGNLWVIGGTTVDPNLARYPAGGLGTSGSKTRDRSININGISCSPGPARLAFDGGGNLWVSVPCADKVVRVGAAQLEASGSVTPGVEITGLDGPEGLAFDGSGNLWIANAGAKRVVKFNASRLGASTSGPDLTIESKTPGPVIGTLDATLLAFDASGNLWVVDFGGNVLYRLSSSDQSGNGSKTLTPAIQVSVPVSALLEGMAFDEGGGLWISYSAGKFARLSPSQLAMGSSPGSPTVPERVIEGGNLGYANAIVFYPAPAGLPLFHRLP